MEKSNPDKFLGKPSLPFRVSLVEMQLKAGDIQGDVLLPSKVAVFFERQVVAPAAVIGNGFAPGDGEQGLMVA